MSEFELVLENLRIEGASRAGDRTWFRVHPPGLAFDVGRGALALTGAEHLFVSHGHLDHALGLPFVLSNRTMQRLGPTRVFCPRATAGALDRFVAAAAELEGWEYDYEARGLDPGDRVDVGRDLLVEAFAVEHGVPALGFHLLRRTRKLLDRHRGRSGAELAALRRRGEPVEEEREELWVSYCGDTGPGVFDLEPRLFTATVLLVECTFVAPGDAGRAAEFGHLHLRDLERHAERFANRAIVLHHLTRRHATDELRREIDRRLPALAQRIHLVD